MQKFTHVLSQPWALGTLTKLGVLISLQMAWRNHHHTSVQHQKQGGMLQHECAFMLEGLLPNHKFIDYAILHDDI